jgi:hypothetical protein
MSKKYLWLWIEEDSFVNRNYSDSYIDIIDDVIACTISLDDELDDDKEERNIYLEGDSIVINYYDYGDEDEGEEYIVLKNYVIPNDECSVCSFLNRFRLANGNNDTFIIENLLEEEVV